MIRPRLLPLVLCLASVAASTCHAQTYRPAGSVALGAPDRWDYVVFDSPSGRVYVAHGDRVTVVDGKGGKEIGEVLGIPGGTHGIAISTATGTGFTDDGKAGQVVAFNLKTLKIVKQIKADDDADGMVLDKASGHIFVIEGDPGAIAVIDVKTQAAAAAIKAGEKMEYAATDDRGALFVAGAANGDLLKIDTRTNQVVARWPAADCKSPHGLAIDRAGGRLFMGCVNNELIVMDSASGRVVAKLTIGKGSDAVAFDPIRKRVFSSNGGDGTISVYRQKTRDSYEALPTIQTRISARTMAVDPVSGRLFLAGADTDPDQTPGGRPKVRPGTLRLMLFDPAE